MPDTMVNRYAHTTDAEYRFQVERAERQLGAALSETAIDHYAAEKLLNAAQACAAALAALEATTGFHSTLRIRFDSQTSEP